ncbi:hypothetical protein Tco_1051257 [Tanacetum coccineum]
MRLEKDKCLIRDSTELKNITESENLTSHKTFFDDFQTNNQTSSPNDDVGEPSRSNTKPSSDSDDNAEEQSSDNDQGSVQMGENDFSKGNLFENQDVPTHLFNTGEISNLRRSSRQSKLPAKLNDYVLSRKARYGMDKFVNHNWLSVDNCGFITNINKSSEPKSFEEDALDKNWVQAMNDEMQALYENNTSIFIDLPNNRKAMGSK